MASPILNRHITATAYVIMLTFNFPLLSPLPPLDFALNIRQTLLSVIDTADDVEAADQQGINRFKDGQSPHACMASGLRRSVSAEPWRREERGQGL